MFIPDLVYVCVCLCCVSRECAESLCYDGLVMLT